MKKGFSGSSKKRSSFSSKGSSSSGKSIFRSSSKPRAKSRSASSSGSFLKDKIRRKKESSFVKPGNDPGLKNRNESYSGDNYSDENTGSAQSSGGGRGCCGGITGMISLFAILAAIVAIVLIMKCAG